MGKGFLPKQRDIHVFFFLTDHYSLKGTGETPTRLNKTEGWA